MPLIRLDWHFNCWRPILNLQNINLLGAGELKCYICHFLWLGIPLPQPQGQLHPTGEGWIHQIAECFLLKAHSFFRSSKEALSISHGIANTPTTSPDHLCAAHTLVFLLFFGTSVLFWFFFPTGQIYFSLCHIMNVQASKQGKTTGLLVYSAMPISLTMSLWTTYNGCLGFLFFRIFLQHFLIHQSSLACLSTKSVRQPSCFQSRIHSCLTSHAHFLSFGFLCSFSFELF